MITLLIAVPLLGVAYAVGRVVGGRRLWVSMLSDRQLGHTALEKLGKAHGAKVELVELP